MCSLDAACASTMTAGLCLLLPTCIGTHVAARPCLCVHTCCMQQHRYQCVEPCLTVHMCCLQEHTCYCRPCRKVRDTQHHQYGLLGATAFTIIMAVVPTLVVLGSLSLCLYLFQRHSRNKQLMPPMLPFSELKLSAESDVLLQGTYG